MSATAASPQQADTNLSLSRALELARQGGKVFPCHWVEEGKCSCKKAECDRAGKHPLWERMILEHGKDNATNDESQILTWAEKWPRANWAFVPESLNWVVLDTDGEQGQQALKTLLGYQKLPHTYLVKTGREGGYHAYFAVPASVTVKEGDLVPRVLTAKSKGYVMLAGCLHYSGRRYTAIDVKATVAVCPDWLMALMQARPPQVALTPLTNDTIPQGKGEPAKFEMAIKLLKTGATREEVLAAVLVLDARCEHQLGVCRG